MDSDAPPTTTPRRLPRRRDLTLTAVLGWVFPGLGQLWAGEPSKALLFAIAIVPTFVVGWWLTDFTIVNPKLYGLDFAAQALLGGPTAFALERAHGRTLEALPRFFDVGRLYVQVAGLLNLVAIADAVGDVVRRNRRVLAHEEIEEAKEAARAAAYEPVAVDASNPPPPPALTAEDLDHPAPVRPEEGA